MRDQSYTNVVEPQNWISLCHIQTIICFLSKTPIILMEHVKSF